MTAKSDVKTVTLVRRYNRPRRHSGGVREGRMFSVEFTIGRRIESKSVSPAEQIEGLYNDRGRDAMEPHVGGKQRSEVAASALMQIPFIERLLPPGKRVGVLTFSGSLLSPDHL